MQQVPAKGGCHGQGREAISFYQREDFVIQSESIDNDTNEKELLMSWKK